MEKFCLNWKDFESNIREHFKKLRGDKILLDVTLATEDGKETKAHKIILSSGSDFFSDIFLKNNHQNMFIFLKGVKRSDLEKVTDFLYNGEVSIAQDEISEFFEIAKLLQIKGLQSKIEEPVEQVTKYEDTDIEHEMVQAILDDVESFKTKDEFQNISDTVDEPNPVINDKKELDCLIEEILEKTEHGKWKCKVCGKIAAQKHQSKNHAETHIQGLSYPCLVCSKTCSTKQNLSAHVSNVHSGVFTCSFCDKTGMNRKEYHNHKRTHVTKNTNV